MNLLDRLALGVGILLALAELWPLVVSGPDSFPISSYPMFTSNRERVHLVAMAYTQGPGAIEQGRAVPPAWISGQEVLLASSTIGRARAQGPAGMQRLCLHVRAEAKAAGVKVHELGYVLEQIDIQAYISSQAQTPIRSVLFRCPLGDA